ncbi:MAG: universal stress protein [Alphaproteobacteria bacterium]|jgi:nucleotide-binding universal stress UspA family protein|nr:universal stress protein [Alphaproteobacteria bacterium]MDG1415915.1 universal stress protein [Alphaproteobacteria bacterium]
MLTKTIVVHLEHSDLGRARVATAVELAARQRSHLTGLFLSLEDFDGDLYGRARGRILEGARHERISEESLQSRLHFEDACKAAGLSSFRFASEIGEDERDLEAHARAADLLIVSDVQERSMEDRFVRGLPETLALSSGLPVLVLPQEYEGAFDPQNVLVAWKSSREAVRAVRDNLTLLRDAKRVTVLSVGTSEETGRLPADQVIHFLERHGISAELRKDYGDNQAGKVVIQTAEEIGADAIIMGANGHPSWRNLILGNTTRYVLRHHRMPLILSN